MQNLIAKFYKILAVEVYGNGMIKNRWCKPHFFTKQVKTQRFFCKNRVPKMLFKEGILLLCPSRSLLDFKLILVEMQRTNDNWGLFYETFNVLCVMSSHRLITDAKKNLVRATENDLQKFAQNHAVIRRLKISCNWHTIWNGSEFDQNKN